MPAIVNIPDILKVGVMAVIFIYGVNKLLQAAGLSQFQA